MLLFKATRSALDRLMGDSDLPDDDSPEMAAMIQASEAIDAARKEAKAV